ncbi:hypothetical protein CWE15_01170 [Aliidiomarina taiwanensis]|uniref:Uncharacterized protein n=1 Tax=Aliidiomarina taiwanensis TaxID=946228 RepID=A0A432X8X2_9GAMM|nr:hypothetical protein CWE15_01170 [Aliidiomarina taiwanensis]
MANKVYNKLIALVQELGIQCLYIIPLRALPYMAFHSLHKAITVIADEKHFSLKFNTFFH